MGVLKNIKVKVKLISAFIIMVILVTIIGCIGITSLKDIERNAEGMYNLNLKSVELILSLKGNLGEIKGELLAMINADNNEEIEKAEKNLDIIVEEDNTYIADLDKLHADKKDEEWEVFKSNLDSYRNARKGIVDAVYSKNYNEAKKQYSAIQSITEKMFDSLDKVVKMNLNNAKLANDSNHVTYTKSNMSMIILNIIGIVLAIILGLVIEKDITIPLNKMKAFAEKLALYDFSTPIIITRKDEFGQTAVALNAAQKNVNELIKAIMDDSHNISASSQELSATVQEISSTFTNINEAVNKITSAIEVTSTSTEEVSASIEEVDSGINELSNKAMEGSNNSNEFKERAEKIQSNSGKAIDETRKLYIEKQEKMLKAIEEGKVVDNIKIMADTIANISEETNLLALNAAIEAARAGEQGRGFAVVAEEVKKLAEQSSQAVTAIQDTILRVQEAFKNSIDNGSDLLKFININVLTQLNDYGDTGSNYHKDADFVSKMSEEIAAMSEEITASVSQVNEAIQNVAESSGKLNEQADRIKESMDETSNAMDQIALTAQGQAELSQSLNEMIQKFKI